MISLTVEKRYGTATVRARVAAPSFEEALALCKDARIVEPGEDTRPSTAAVPGGTTRVSPGEPPKKLAA